MLIKTRQLIPGKGNPENYENGSASLKDTFH
jgi:hypothetical protein